MQEDTIVGVTKTLMGVPTETLLGIIALSAFALAAFAIYAVLSVIGGRK